MFHHFDINLHDFSMETSFQGMQGQGRKDEMWKSQALGETDRGTTAHTTKMDKLLD